MSDPKRLFAKSNSWSQRVALVSILSLSTWSLLASPSCIHGGFGRLRVNCPHSDATLFVDGKYLGPIKVLANADVRLPAGWHQVEIRKKGFYARYRRIRIRPGSVTLLAVHLAPTLDWVLSSHQGPGKRTGKVTEQ